NEGLTGRRLTGLALSPTVATDRRMVACGAGEGVVRSDDGGVTWLEADEGLPLLQVTDVAIGVTPEGECRLYAALPEGIWTCPWGGTAWEKVSDLPAHLLTLSPAFGADATAVIATAEGDLWASTDGLQNWQRVDVPWRRQEIVALEVSPAFDRDGR